MLLPELVFKSDCKIEGVNAEVGSIFTGWEFVYIGEATYQQKFLALKIAVNRPWGNLREFADILDTYPLKAVLPHSLHRRKKDPCFGIIQSNHIP